MERYRSGHNGDASKAFCVKAHVGSNPTRSAPAKKADDSLSAFFFFGVRKPPHSFGIIPGQKSQKHHAAFLSSLFAGKNNFNAVFIRRFFIGKTLENARFYRIITHEFPHTLRIKGDAPPLTKAFSSDIFALGHRDRGKGESRVHMA